MDLKKLSGKIALVTGSSRGIGRAIVERLSREGAAVAINYVSSSGKADEVEFQLGLEFLYPAEDLL